MQVRNGFLDYSRLVAALGIVWFHTQAPGTQIAYAALPFFLVLLSLPSRSSLKDRALRLLLPFLAWSAIYGALQVVLAWQSGRPLFGWWQHAMLLTGTLVHLWFLPFAFLVALVATWLPQGRISLAMPVLAAGTLAVNGIPLAWPWYQWSFALVPVLVGLAYRGCGLLALPSLVIAWGMLEAVRPSPDNLAILLGSALAIAAMQIRLPATEVSASCARLAMLVYLSHVLVILRGKVLGLSGYELAAFAVPVTLILAFCLDSLIQRVLKRRGRAAISPATS